MRRVRRYRALWATVAAAALTAGLVFVNISAQARSTFAGPWSVTMASDLFIQQPQPGQRPGRRHRRCRAPRNCR
jgi:hypothetical protein